MYCAQIARNTFFIEDDAGRARAFARQPVRKRAYACACACACACTPGTPVGAASGSLPPGLA